MRPHSVAGDKTCVRVTKLECIAITKPWGNMTGHMKIHLVNPSDTAFGTAVITPRWLYVLAAATPTEFGDPLIWDETLDPLDPMKIQAGDVVGIGIHTGNALRGYAVGRIAGSTGLFGTKLNKNQDRYPVGDFLRNRLTTDGTGGLSVLEWAEFLLVRT